MLFLVVFSEKPGIADLKSSGNSGKTVLLSDDRRPSICLGLPTYTIIITHQIKGQQTATADSDVVQSGRPIFDDFFQHLWPYIGNNTANVVFQMVKRLWLIRIDQ
ncbi:hypothetical protein TNCV_978471 [Trichonephila clavipes]|nr:hypothetical protein TNCV_978471 [Trichonephila clavipes]